jgi:diguanylate cyclase (GGDEF)-like protein
MSIRNKILLPFFLILIVLGCGATLVSVLLITEALSDTADQRLLAYREVVFREIKKQETLLDTFAHLLQLDQFPADLKDTRTRNPFHDQLFNSLREAGISLALYPAGMRDDHPSDSVRTLFQQAYRSGKPRFRFTTDIDSTPALAVAATTSESKPPSRIILLRAPVDKPFLKQLSAPFGARISLFSTNGDFMVSSEKDHRPLDLSAEELENLMSGRHIIKTERDPLPFRRLVSGIPLGTTDLIILCLDIPMADLEVIIKTLATGSVLAISLALLLGGYIYYRLIRKIMTPIKELLTATQAVGAGNLDFEIRQFARDEMGQLAESFEAMLRQLRGLWKTKVEQEKQLTLVQEELKYKQLLEQKNGEIEATNRELKSHVKELSALFQLNQAMISTLDLNVLFDRMLQVLRDLLQCSDVVLLLYDPGADKLEVRRTIGPESERIQGVTFRLDEGITGLAAQTQKLFYIRDLAADERSLNYKTGMMGTGSMVSVPLVVKNRLVGVLNIHNEKIDGFTEAELKLIQAVANQAAIAVENARLYERTRDLSNTDELTNLANRRHFQEILKRETAHARRYHSPFSLIMADIDNFKRFNDIHGHLIGDMVLKKVANLLLQNTRGIDLVGRFGGEEFIILLPKTDKEGAMAAAEKLRQRMAEERFLSHEHAGPLTLSLGIAEFPTDSNEIYELIDLADRALYQAKEAGRNRVAVWNGKAEKMMRPTSAETCTFPPK